MEEFEKSIQAHNLARQAQVIAHNDMDDYLEKGKELPIGTERKHGGRTVVKTAKGWVPKKSEKKVEKKDEKSGLAKVAASGSKKQLYEAVNKKYKTSFKPGSIEEFEDDDMRTQLDESDIKAIVDAEKKDEKTDHQKEVRRL